MPASGTVLKDGFAPLGVHLYVAPPALIPQPWNRPNTVLTRLNAFHTVSHALLMACAAP